MGPDVSSRTWTNLITTLDSDRLFFLASDIARFREQELLLADALRAGDMGFAYEVVETFKLRFSNRVDYIGGLLEQGFDWEGRDTYTWDRKRADWPADEAEWNRLWRLKIQNEYLRMMLAREAETLAATNRLAAAAERVEETPGADAPERAATDPDLTALLMDLHEGAPETAREADVFLDAEPLAEPLAGLTNAPPLPSIEAAISNRYLQAWMIIEDNDSDWVLQQWLNAFTQAYDPHSSFMTPASLEDFQIEMNLALSGIGAMLSAEDGAAKIVSLIPGGPADRDPRDRRLQPGDKIIAVAQDNEPAVDVLHWPLNKIVKLIRGPKGTRVVLTVIPVTDPGGTLTKIVDIVRDEVKLEARAASGSIRKVGDEQTGETNRLGIVRLPSFYGSMNARSPEDPGFRSAGHDVLRILNSQKVERVEGVLLDLRGNGGGALVEAIDMTGLFIPRGPVVQVKERFSLRALEDQDPRVHYTGPLVVLVNRQSASASEILAGALQDYGRAVIVGDSKTHGKGTVQTVLDLGRDKSMGSLKVTTASFIRVTGAPTQKWGVTPDIIVPSPWDFMEIGEEFLPNVLLESMERPARFRPEADLSEAIGVLRERSERRRRENPSFQAYARMLERLAQLNREKTLSLNLEERRTMAEAERELMALQERLSADEDAPEKPENGAANGANGATREPPADPVLAEALEILRDLVEWHRDPVALATRGDEDAEAAATTAYTEIP